MGVYKKQPKKNQPFNNQRYRKIDVLLQAKIYHCFLWIYPLQQSHVENKDLYGEPSITREHIQNNQSVRALLGDRGIKPEELPAAEDIKKLERKVTRDEKKIEQASQKLPKNKK